MNRSEDQYNAAHQLWLDAKDKIIKSDSDEMEYIDLDQSSVDHAGLNHSSLKEPGNLTTFHNPAQSAQHKYTLHSLGKGRFRMNRHH